MTEVPYFPLTLRAESRDRIIVHLRMKESLQFRISTQDPRTGAWGLGRCIKHRNINRLDASPADPTEQS
jgi:hypothetical protein